MHVLWPERICKTCGALFFWTQCNIISKKAGRFYNNHLYPVGSLTQRLDNHFLIVFSPLPHPLVRINHSVNVRNDIFVLSSLVMQRHAERRQRLENSSDVDLWATGNAYTKILQGKFDEVLHELKDLLSRGW